MGFKDLHNLFNIYVVEVGESIADIPTGLLCLGDLENLVPVQQVLRGTGNCVLYIFTVSSLFMFLRVRNPFLAFVLSYHVRVTLKSRSTSGTRGTDDSVLQISI